MNEEGPEGIKKKKLEEQQKKAQEKELENKLKSALRVALEPDAYERLATVGYGNKELYTMAAQQILMVYSRAKRKITDEELLYLLKAIKQKTQHESTITFK